MTTHFIIQTAAPSQPEVRVMNRIAFAYTSYRKAENARRDFFKYSLVAAVIRDCDPRTLKPLGLARLDLHIPKSWTDDQARTAFNKRIPEVFVEIRSAKS